MMMIEIDGSHGEGGGQILRSALTLSLVTGRPFRLVNIRAGRKKPGLMPQHLQAVQAAAAVGRAEVDGDRQGSTALSFTPRGVHAGEYRFDIGTAGSTSLVLQTVLIPLAAAAESSRLIVTGGTHVPWSPTFHYLDLLWLPSLRRIGLEASLEMERAGFYPPGGGLVRAAVAPAASLSPLRLTERGRVKKITCLSAVANLDRGIAERQRRQAENRLAGIGEIEARTIELPAPSPGTMLLLLAEFQTSRCCYCALGERGKPAERVADEAVDGLLAFLATEAAVDEHLADQLVLPLALAAGESEFTTCRVTGHLETNARVVQRFLPIRIDIEGEVGRPGRVRIEGAGVALGHRVSTS